MRDTEQEQGHGTRSAVGCRGTEPSARRGGREGRIQGRQRQRRSARRASTEASRSAARPPQSQY
eukprot:2371148-Rhodomonas_salina.3